MKNILIATDLSERGVKAIRRGGLIAAAEGATLHILRVIEDEVPADLVATAVDLSRKQIARVLEQGAVPAEVKVSVEVLPGRAWRLITQQAGELEADLVIFGRHATVAGPLSLPGTTIERVMRSTRIPVLLVSLAADTPYREVVIGVDFGAQSRLALTASKGIAPGAHLNIVHAFHAIRGEAFGGEAQRIEENLHRRELDKMLKDELPEALDDGRTRIVLAETGPSKLIRHVAREQDADLVIVGTHGRAGLGRMILGSVAEDLLAEPPCDVLAVRAL